MRAVTTALLAGGAFAFLLASQAQAGTYAISVVTGLTSGGFETLSTPPAFQGDTAQASFTYRGDLNFGNTAGQNTTPGGDLNSTFGFAVADMSAYKGSGQVVYQGKQVANFVDRTRFTRSSGSIAGYGYASWYRITLSNVVAGTNLAITHDDGINLYKSDGTRVAGGVSGPTAAVTDTYTNLGAGTYTLYYSRQNGTPSILQVAVPEPASIALFGAGLLGLGLVRRRRDRKAA